MIPFNDVTEENMTALEAKEYLGMWLHESAVLEHYQFRGMYEDDERLHRLTQKAWELLGEQNYSKIYRETIKPYL